MIRISELISLKDIMNPFNSLYNKQTDSVNLKQYLNEKIANFQHNLNTYVTFLNKINILNQN